MKELQNDFILISYASKVMVNRIKNRVYGIMIEKLN